ncbi:FtsX-like permease family protein [Streptantibioticus parmotrematis]|uniref:FtsX-like permease family protein n=1 Tax=Streptantibioticus parmotrematis TaxID=2873249 RepID=UPI0033E88ADA
MSAPHPERPARSEHPERSGSAAHDPFRVWARDLGLGMRFAVTGGREGWIRTLLTAVGVGLGVALLLTTAAVPAMLQARSDRTSARSTDGSGAEPTRPGPHTLLVEPANTTYRWYDITGDLFEPEGAEPPLPPGVSRMPGPGEMVVSPALASMLADPANQLLRERLPQHVVGTVGAAGLSGPKELLYYAGAHGLSQYVGMTRRIDRFGGGFPQDPWTPVLIVLLVIVFVVLLVPVGVFVATAVRFGGERRDRRLAALRLIGADSRTTRRIAAGEALCGALLGLVAGAAVFLGLRQAIGTFSLDQTSVFPSDMTPAPELAALIAVAVPVAAVMVTLLALRGVVIEPLGVVRGATPRRRRLWWRLLVPAAGLAMLYPLIGTVAATGPASSVNRPQVAAGAVLLLLGLTTLLPWLVQTVVVRLGGGGPVPWQLASRRLQLSSGVAARTVSGITVAVAGAIAVQAVFAGVAGQFTHDTGQDTASAQMAVDIPVRDGSQVKRVVGAFRTTEGVRQVMGTAEGEAADLTVAARARNAARSGHGEQAEDDLSTTGITVGDCATLRQVARIGSCSPGSVFLVTGLYGSPPDPLLTPGHRLDLSVPGTPGATGDGPRPWTIPASARTVTGETDATGYERSGVLATPEALDPDLLQAPQARIAITLDPGVPDAEDLVRNTAVRIDPSDPTTTLHATQEAQRYVSLRRGLMIGAVAVLVMIGASLLVSMLEQLRERRRLLATLVAFGTRRRTLGLSVLWQAAVPMALGLVLAVAGGLGLGAVLLRVVNESVGFDWTAVAVMAGAGAGVVVLVTLLSLPPLWRMMRPDGLRTE